MSDENKDTVKIESIQNTQGRINQQQETAITIESGLQNIQKNKDSANNQEVSDFQDSLMNLKNLSTKKKIDELDVLSPQHENQKLKTAQNQLDQSRQEQNQKNKKELMIKSNNQLLQIIEGKKGQNNQAGLVVPGGSPSKKFQTKGFFNKIKGIISIEKMKVQPHKKMSSQDVQKKFQKAFMIIKTIVRLNKISENIRNYGTSSDLFNVATRDRPTVKKVLFPLSTLNEEQEEQDLAEALPFPLIHPESKVNKFWNPLYLILMLYTATVMPYRIAFENDIPQGWLITDYFTDTLFWIDMLINMFTAFYNEDGVLVKTRKEVIMNYMKTWFIIDFLACFPFEPVLQELLGGDSDEADTIKLVKLTRLPRMYRLVRITKVVKLFKFFDKNSFLDFLQFNTGILRLISLFMTVLLIVHLMGCFWFYIAKMNDFSEETWVYRQSMQNEDSYSLYIASIYYSFTALTTVGYGDITAGTNMEMIVTMIWMVFGVGFYSFTIGILSSVLAHMDTKSTNLQKKISIMNEFCNEMKISKDLKQKLRKALTFNSDKNCFSWADQQNIFRQLPINLRYEICMNIHQGVMKTFNFFTMEDDKYFVTRIVPILKPLHIEESEILWMEGWNPESIYLLSQGRVRFMSNTADQPANEKEPLSKLQINKAVRFKSMINGSYFGEIDIIKNRKRQFSAVCESECELYYLPRFEYENIVKRDFPHIDEKLRQIAEERDKKNEQALAAIKKILRDPNKEQTEEAINEQIRIETKQQQILEKMGANKNKENGQQNEKSPKTETENIKKQLEKVNGIQKQPVNQIPLNNQKNMKKSGNESEEESQSDNEEQGSQSEESSEESSDCSSDEISQASNTQNNIQQIKEELMKYQEKANIIENKFDDLEKSLENTLMQLQSINGGENTETGDKNDSQNIIIK